ncbi:arginase [Ekhidna sp.]
MSKIQIVEVRSEFGAGTRGASLGIDAIKLASAKLGSNFFSKYPTQIVDLGNHQALFEEEENRTAKYIEEIHKVEIKVCDTIAQLSSTKFPIVLAGDHSSGGGTLSGIKKANPTKRIGAVWIDAHADLHTPYTTPSGNVHGMPLAMSLSADNKENAVNELTPKVSMLWEKMKNVGLDGPKLNPEDIVFIALRDTELPEDSFIEKHGIKVFKVEEVREKTTKTIVEETLKYLKDCDLICISFDVDSMDPDDVSWGTGTPVPGGLTKEEAVEINRGLIENPKIASWEMVEVNPLLDKENAMGEAAFEILEAVVKAKK